MDIFATTFDVFLDAIFEYLGYDAKGGFEAVPWSRLRQLVADVIPYIC